MLVKRRDGFLEEWDRLAEACGITPDKLETKRRILKPESGNFYLSINYNAWKNKRPTVAEGACPFDGMMDKYAIIGSLYLPYVIIPNTYPGVRGHSLAVHARHDEPYEICEEDLWKFRQIARDTGFNVNVNMKGSGASVTVHKHAHVIPKRMPLQLLNKRHAAFRTKEAPDFPYLHAIFEGGNRVKDAAGAIARCDGPYVLLIDPYDIYFLPFRKETDRGFASSEAGGMFFVDSEEEFGKGYDHFRRRMDEALIRRDECDIYEFLKTPRRLGPKQ